MDLPRRLVLRGLCALPAARLVAGPCGAAEPRFDVADLGTLPGGRSTEPRAIDSKGEVVGVTARRGGVPIAFLWRDGKLITLADTHSEATALNDRGEIGGSVHETGKDEHATLWRHTAGGTFRAIDLGPGSVRSINPKGQIVGSFARGSIWTSGAGETGSTRRVEVKGIGAAGASSVELVAINDQGQAVGLVHEMVTEVYPGRGFLWKDGEATELGSLGGPHCRPTALNASGQVAGSSTYRAIPRGIAPLYLFHAFLWQKGTIRDLGALGAGRYSEALGLNAKGDVVGWSSTQADDDPFGSRGRAAFLYRDGAMLDLNRSIPPDSGWTLTEARAINDRGQVVGIGRRDGQPRGFLLTPR
jgi:probable HAF family extracellular repeat protein